jgi:carbonic anhydrase
MAHDDPHDSMRQFFLGRPKPRQAPADAAAAQKALEEGNRQFAGWVRRCYDEQPATAEELGLPESLGRPGEIPKQAPFATVVACSDARVPVRLLLGQSVNDVFEIRVAGNALDEEGLGSVEYALRHLPSTQVVAVFGHTHCGAITAAVDSYLQPSQFNPTGPTRGVRAIIHRGLGAVLQAAGGLEQTDRAAAPGTPQYREQLIETAVYLNAAGAAQELQLAVRDAGKQDRVRALFGVYDLADQYLKAPRADQEGRLVLAPGLAPAPADATALEQMARAVADQVARRAASV